jgi:flagellar hook-length control protein FliK
VSSTASNVSATPPVQTSPWPQTPAATQDSNGGPFAALLDAAAATPDKTNAQPAAPKTPSAADQPAAKLSFDPRRPAGATGATDTTQNPSPDAKAAAATNSAAVTVPGGANSTATANPPTTANATAAQPGATAPADIAGVGAALSALANATLNIATDASGNATTPQQTTKTAPDGGKGNADATGVTSNASAAAVSDLQAQPVAALISANTVISTPPAASNAAPGATIGGSATVGAISVLSFADAAAAAPSQDTNNVANNTAPAQQTNDASSAQNASNAAAAQNANPPASAATNAALSQDGQIPAAQPNGNNGATGQDTKPTAPARDGKLAAVSPDANVAVLAQTAKVAAPVQGTKATEPTKQSSSLPGSDPIAAAGNADAGAPADATNSQAWNGNAAPQTPARADSDTVAPAPAGGNAAPRPNEFATADAGGSSGAPSGWNAAKAVTDGLPNFGFASATQAASVATAATPGTATTATVPVAGLAVAIAARAQAGSSQFDIRLDPPELGRIDVRLDVDRNGQVTSHVTVDRADTLQLLQSQQPQLERALEQAGLKTADNGLQFTLRDQSFSGQNGNGGTPSSPTWLVIPDADQSAIPTTQIYSRAGLGSGVDIRV